MVNAGARIRDYEVWGRLSEGGMSEVWLAKHAVLNIPVIVKTLKTHLVDDSHGKPFDRLLNEARVMARIPSPRVVRALDAGVHEGTAYVVQEYVDGIDFAELDRARREALGLGLPLWFVCHAMREICLALQASHQTGILHRDVKPSNVFGSPQTGIRLGDFGIAIPFKQGCGSGEVSGTFKFMAPEQIRGDAVDGVVDVYGAGATAFDLRYASSPFGDVISTLDGRIAPQFPEASTPAEAYFQHLVRRMIEKDPKKRARMLGALARDFGVLADALVREVRGARAAVRIGKNQVRLDECTIDFDTGDIAEAKADAIVNSALDNMQMRGGCGNALRARGGDEIEKEATSGGTRALGTCIATQAGKLDARWVLHTVSGWNEVSCVGRAAHRALLLGERLGARSIAFPALGTGASRVTFETCASALGTALRHHLSLGGSRLRHVRFVLRNDQVRDVFRDVAIEALLEETPTGLDLGLEVQGVEVRADAATFVRATQSVE